MPDKDGMVSAEERKAWGLLGRPPSEFANASKRLRERWFVLDKRCKAVEKIWDRRKRVHLAKEIERDRQDIVDQMRSEQEIKDSEAIRSEQSRQTEQT